VNVLGDSQGVSNYNSRTEPPPPKRLWWSQMDVTTGNMYVETHLEPYSSALDRLGHPIKQNRKKQFAYINLIVALAQKPLEM